MKDSLAPSLLLIGMYLSLVSGPGSSGWGQENSERVTQETTYFSRDGLRPNAEAAFLLYRGPMEDPSRKLLRFEPVRVPLNPVAPELTITISGHGTTYQSSGVKPGYPDAPPNSEWNDSDLDVATVAAGVTAVLLLPAEMVPVTVVATGGIIAAELFGLTRKIVADIDAYETQVAKGKFIRGKLWIRRPDGGARPSDYQPTRYQRLGTYVYDDLYTAKRPGHISKFISGKIISRFAGLPLSDQPELVQYAAGEFAGKLPEVPGSGGGAGGTGSASFRDPVTGFGIPFLPPDSLTPTFSPVSPAPQISVAVSIQRVLAVPSLPVAAKANLRAWQTAGVSEVVVSRPEQNTVIITPRAFMNEPMTPPPRPPPEAVPDTPPASQDEPRTPPRGEPRSSPHPKRFTVTGTPWGSFDFGK